MTNARSLRVYLGSSITELEDERVSFSESISRDLTRLFEQDDIIIQFLKCESIHEGNDGTPDQDKIDEMLRKCDVSLFLFKDKEGKYTLHEYETARALQKEMEHKIYVYYLREGKANKPGTLTPFQERLRADGVHWKVCDNLSDLKYQFAMGLLKNLGVRCGATVRAAGEVKERGEALFEQCQQDHQLMHQEIEKLLAQIDPVMEDAETPIAARITQVLGLYQKADLWASKTDYDKEKYSRLLFAYASFLDDYGMYYDAGQVYLYQIIPLAEEIYGTNHDSTATDYNETGEMYLNQGDYPQALEYYQKALARNEKVLGKEHRDTAASYNNIGRVYYAQGNYPQALEYYQKALEIREKVLGKEHPYTSTSYNNLGLVYKAQGDYPQALEYYQKALEIREKGLGKEHSSTASTYNNIGAVYYNQGNYPKALEYYQKALAIHEKGLGKEYSDTERDYYNIGAVYHAQGNYPKALEYYQKALEYYQQALAWKEKVLGKEDSSTAIDYHNIGSLYYQLGKYSEALEYLEKALIIFKARWDDDHPFTKTTQEWIDATRAAMGK